MVPPETLSKGCQQKAFIACLYTAPSFLTQWPLTTGSKTPSLGLETLGWLRILHFPPTLLLKLDKPGFEFQVCTHLWLILGKSQPLHSSVSSSVEGRIARIK